MRRALRLLLVVGALVGVYVAVMQSGILDHVRDEQALRSTVEAAGVLGPLLFVALMTALVPFNVPGILFVLPSTMLFGTIPGVLLSILGGFLASMLGVVAARRLGRDAIQARLPRRIRRLERWMTAHGFWSVAALRSTTFLLQPVDWLCGVSQVPMRTVMTGTLVGLVPPTLVIALSGGAVLDLVLG